MIQLNLPDEIISSSEKFQKKDTKSESTTPMLSLGRSRSLTFVSKIIRAPPLLKRVISWHSNYTQENDNSYYNSNHDTSSKNDEKEENLLESLAPSGIRHHNQWTKIMITTPTVARACPSNNQSLNPLDD
jgi:hypothetical protein